MPTDPNAILKLEVPVIVQIGERMMTVKDIVSLVPGSIVEIPKSADDELEILVNNKAIGTGHAVKVGENFGLRIDFVGNLHERLAALAAGSGRTSRDEQDELAGLADQLVGSQ